MFSFIPLKKLAKYLHISICLALIHEENMKVLHTRAKISIHVFVWVLDFVFFALFLRWGLHVVQAGLVLDT